MPILDLIFVIGMCVGAPILIWRTMKPVNEVILYRIDELTAEQRRDKYDLREIYKADFEAQERRKEREEDRRRSRYNKTHLLVKNVRRILQ